RQRGDAACGRGARNRGETRFDGRRHQPVVLQHRALGGNELVRALRDPRVQRRAPVSRLDRRLVGFQPADGQRARARHTTVAAIECRVQPLNTSARMSRRALLVAAVVAGWMLTTWYAGLRQGFLFLIGVGLGGALAAVAFGFTTGWRV